ncbi:LPXTG cell wall anchor domain-containing protein [Streptomyces sp. NPDC088097]|uniref:LPXTG cell wall anchor domain-containing protein n=1 Tax=Streptomyces sp. NPDC088097 TaxID=3365823 RepID=UPI003822C465
MTTATSPAHQGHPALRPAIRPAVIGLGLLLLLQGLALIVVLALAGSAQAHGDNLTVVITGQRDGHVTADITWENDGDPVEETVAATVNAVSPDGSRTQGPWPLVRQPGSPAGWMAAGALPPGTWTVTIDAGFPALGHAEHEVSVPVVDPAPSIPTSPSTPDASRPGTAAPVTSALPASAAPSVAPEPAGKGSDATGWWTTAGVAGIALAGAAAGILLRRRRRR